MVLFGQIVVGPPGAGKSTFCKGVRMFMEELGRSVITVNLDFANDTTPYKPEVDVRELITLQDVMEEHDLGPNGGLMFCMGFLLENVDWLKNKIKSFPVQNVVFDMPGQVELFTHDRTLLELIKNLEKSFDLRLCCVNLLDSFYCSQPATFISAVILVSATMLRLGLPHVNILSKVDLLSQYGPLPFSLDFFTELLDLEPILRYLDKPISRIDEAENETENENEDHSSFTGQKNGQKSRFRDLAEALCGVAQDTGLVSFRPLHVDDPETMSLALASIDRANGFCYVTQESVERRQENKNTIGQSVGTTREEVEKKRELYYFATNSDESLFSHSLRIQEKYSCES